MIDLDPEKMLINSIALSELKRQRLRTGLGSALIVRKLPKDADTPSAAMIEGWVGGQRKFAKPAHLEMVLTAYAQQPDGKAHNSGVYVTMTDELRQELRVIHGKSASGYLDHAPERVTPAKLSHLLNGRTKKISGALLQWFRKEARSIPPKRLIKRYPPAPDLEDAGLRPLRPERTYKPRSTSGNIIYIEITEALHSNLHDEVSRTRVSTSHLVRSLSDVPRGLSVQMVRSWHTGKIQAAEQRYFEYIMDEYRKLPTF